MRTNLSDSDCPHSTPCVPADLFALCDLFGLFVNVSFDIAFIYAMATEYPIP